MRVGVIGGGETASGKVDEILAATDGARRALRPPWDALVALGARAGRHPVVRELARSGVPLLVAPRVARVLPGSGRTLVLRPVAYLPGIVALRDRLSRAGGVVSAWLRTGVPGGLPHNEAALGSLLESALGLVLAVLGPDIRAARARRIDFADGDERLRIGVAGLSGRYAEIEIGGRAATPRMTVDTTAGSHAPGSYDWHRYDEVERLRFRSSERDPDSGHNVARAQYTGDPLSAAIRSLVDVARERRGRPECNESPWDTYAEGRLRHLVSRTLELIREPVSPAIGSWPSGRGDFLLVHLPRRRPYGDTLRLPNLGLARVAAALRQDGVPVRIADLDAIAWQGKGIDLEPLADSAAVARAVEEGETPPALAALTDALVRHLPLASPPAVVGFSVLDREGAAHLAVARLLARAVRRLAPRALIVLGGVTDELHADEVLGTEEAIDVVVEGDGEVAARRLIEAHALGLGELANAPNLCLRPDGRILRTPSRTVRMADRPGPDFRDVPLAAYRRGLSDQLRRALREQGVPLADDRPRLYLPYAFVLGCLGRCTFCGFGERVDLLSEDRIVAQLASLVERHDCRDFVFLNTTANLSPRRLDRLCDALVAADLDLRWTDSARPHGIGERLAAKMHRAGCVLLSFGVESGSDRILRSMRKGFVREQAERTLAAVHDAGILTRVNLIAGYLHEQDDDIAATVSLVEDNHRHIDMIGCFNGFQLLPAAGFDPEEHGIRLLPFTDRVDPDQISVAYDELDGPDWAGKKQQIRRSRAAVLKAIEACGIYYGAVIDEYDLFWLSRHFAAAEPIRRLLLRPDAAVATWADRPPAPHASAAGRGEPPRGPGCP